MGRPRQDSGVKIGKDEGKSMRKDSLIEIAIALLVEQNGKASGFSAPWALIDSRETYRKMRMCDLEKVVVRMKGAFAEREAAARRGREEEMTKEHERQEQLRECSDMERADFGHSARQPCSWR